MSIGALNGLRLLAALHGCVLPRLPSGYAWPTLRNIAKSGDPRVLLFFLLVNSQNSAAGFHGVMASSPCGPFTHSGDFHAQITPGT